MRNGLLNLPIRTRRVAAYDADAAAFFTAAGITDGTQKAAVNTLILGLKSAALWTSFYALYPFVGGTSGAHAVNAKTPGTYNITWTNSPTHNANGVTFNGTTNYGRCVGLTGNSVVPHLCGITTYLRTTNITARADGTYHSYGGIKNAATLYYFIGAYKDTGASLTQNRGCIGAVAGTVSDGPPKAIKTGCLSINRTSATSMKGYDDGVEYLSYPTSDTSTPPAVDYYVGATNDNGAGINSACNENLALYAVHAGFTAGQSATLSTLIAAFQTALSRNV